MADQKRKGGSTGRHTTERSRCADQLDQGRCRPGSYNMPYARYKEQPDESKNTPRLASNSPLGPWTTDHRTTGPVLGKHSPKHKLVQQKRPQPLCKWPDQKEKREGGGGAGRHTAKGPECADQMCRSTRGQGRCRPYPPFPMPRCQDQPGKSQKNNTP